MSNVCQDNQLNPFGHESSSLTISNSFSFSDPFTFTYGTPFGLLFQLQTYAVADGSGTANSDFANTLVLSGLHPFGPDMQPVTGATFTSISGTQYGSNGVISANSRTFFFGTRRLGSHDFVGSGFPATNSLCGAFPPCLQRPD